MGQEEKWKAKPSRRYGGIETNSLLALRKWSCVAAVRRQARKLASILLGLLGQNPPGHPAKAAAAKVMAKLKAIANDLEVKKALANVLQQAEKDWRNE